jgi:hypothetical protein
LILTGFSKKPTDSLGSGFFLVRQFFSLDRRESGTGEPMHESAYGDPQRAGSWKPEGVFYDAAGAKYAWMKKKTKD